MRFLTLAVMLIFAAVSTWIMGIRMRRRIKKALGTEATGAELISLSTWMKVDEAERRKPLGD